MKLILLSIPDLMFETRIADVARKLGHSVETFGTAKIASASLVIVGLENNHEWNAAVESAHNQNVPSLAFAGHTHADLLRQARYAGCTRVVVNSDIAAKFPQLLGELLTPSHNDTQTR